MGKTTKVEYLSFETLQKKKDKLGEDCPDAVSLRVHRALSWLQRAEVEMKNDDPDAAFIFHWIAFNAIYAKDQSTDTERNRFKDYFEEVTALDAECRIIERAIRHKFRGPIRLLLNNKYVFQPFWNHHNQVSGFRDWEERFERSKCGARTALERGKTRVVLSILFDRLYVLRNQLLHGGATWKSSINREQVQDGSRIMAFLVPLFIDLMMEHPHEDWGAPSYYPVV